MTHRGACYPPRPSVEAEYYLKSYADQEECYPSSPKIKRKPIQLLFSRSLKIFLIETCFRRCMSSSCSEMFVPRQILDMKGVFSQIDILQIAVVIRSIIFLLFLLCF